MTLWGNSGVVMTAVYAIAATCGKLLAQNNSKTKFNRGTYLLQQKKDTQNVEFLILIVLPPEKGL